MSDTAAASEIGSKGERKGNLMEEGKGKGFYAVIISTCSTLLLKYQQPNGIGTKNSLRKLAKFATSGEVATNQQSNNPNSKTTVIE